MTHHSKRAFQMLLDHFFCSETPHTDHPFHRAPASFSQREMADVCAPDRQHNLLMVQKIAPCHYWQPVRATTTTTTSLSVGEGSLSLGTMTHTTTGDIRRTGHPGWKALGGLLLGWRCGQWRTWVLGMFSSKLRKLFNKYRIL